jgi:hypothetical protein
VTEMANNLIQSGAGAEPVQHNPSDGAQPKGDAVDIRMEETASRPSALKIGNQIIGDKTEVWFRRRSAASSRSNP